MNVRRIIMSLNESGPTVVFAFIGMIRGIIIFNLVILIMIGHELQFKHAQMMLTCALFPAFF